MKSSWKELTMEILAQRTLKGWVQMAFNRWLLKILFQLITLYFLAWRMPKKTMM